MLKELTKTAGQFLMAHKAQIMIGAGIAGNAAATIIACVKTTKAKDILDDHNARREEIEEAKIICRREVKIYELYHQTHDENGAPIDPEDGTMYQKPCTTEKYENYQKYLEHDFKKDTAITYGKTALKFIKHYALPGALFIVSNAAIAIGAGFMTKEIAGLSSALATTTAAFSNYRERVKQAIGEEAEHRIYTNEQVEVQKYKDIDDDGNEIEKEQTVIKTDGKNSPYALKLNRWCYQYHNDIDKTLSELKEVEKQLNRDLVGKGMVTLNEVFEALGCRKTAAGQQVGWVYCSDPEEQVKHGDGYISFGLFDHCDDNGNIMQEPQKLTDQWVEIRNSHISNRQSDTDEYEIWLFFNVDGVITQYMEDKPGLPL